MQGVLPEEILRRDKMGFGAPIGQWLRGPLRSFVDDVLARAPDRGYVDPDEARRVIEHHLSARDENGLLVWCLVMLELWFQWIESLPPAPRSRGLVPLLIV
jgi:asparagine synthase (glutamine-hydrolysing)